MTVPGLITILDIDTAEPITTAGMCYGNCLAVIGIFGVPTGVPRPAWRWLVHTTSGIMWTMCRLRRGIVK
ncbi:MAG: hypothetical protein KDE54_37930 [Caldilineaceae bacterium]|nr:hypothetical protein [Caldilineaceae bacterium]MCB0094567.1 hypothetical protein [Caldilineaceae bacterium]